MTLFIDSTEREVLVRLVDGERVVRELRYGNSANHAQALLPSIERLLALEEPAYLLSDLTQIVVNPGPGSFTGTRVGVTVANALGFALGVPVNNQSIGQPVTPVYASQPHITLPKKRS